MLLEPGSDLNGSNRRDSYSGSSLLENMNRNLKVLFFKI